MGDAGIVGHDRVGMIDGYFAFWAVAALWLCWENLQRPRHFGWLAAYVFCLTILVLTKENAAFVVFAIFATLLLNRFLRMGTVTPHLLAATIIGPAFAVVILIGLIGGVSEWLRFYLMKKGSALYNTGKDLFGQDYGVQTVDTLPKVPAVTWNTLSDVADTAFFSPYGHY